MLGLKMPTDPRWVKIAEKNLGDVLSDHAWCEQKAATNAISIITRNHDLEDVVDALTEIAQEEIEHFAMVVQKIRDRGLTLGREGKDAYVRDLAKFINGGGNSLSRLIDNLLLSAMIEARSCERFRILSEEIEDEDLRVFYRELMESEANHYTVFLGLARKYGGREAVDARWHEFLEFEAQLMKKYGKEQTMHG